MTKRRNDSGRLEATTMQPPSAPGTDGHDEWLLDESIEETFPASDPTLPVRPGSSLSERNALHRRGR
jgi:hypothetical protein